MADLRVLSLGGGVQSTALAYMAHRGDIEPIDCAIFADTGWETKATLANVEKIRAAVSFPVYTVEGLNLREQFDSDRRFVSLPFFTSGGGMGRRQCTREAKVTPITKFLRKKLGFAPGERIAGKKEVELWLGISTDEIQRCKENREKWIKNRFPLIESRMSRGDCIKYLEHRQIQVPEPSACIGCPYKTDAEWKRLRAESPDEYADAVHVDELARNRTGFNESQFLHRSCKPLDQAIDSASSQKEFGFLQECDGLCGN